MRAVLPRDVEIGADLFEMTFVDQRTDLGGRIERMADFELLDPFGEARVEFIGDVLLDQQAA